MKNNFFKYLILFIAVDIISLPNVIGANRNQIEKLIDQSSMDSSIISQDLHDFIEQAVKQGLSLDEIVEQGIVAGYTKEQIIEAYSAATVNEAEGSSIQETVVWCALGAAAVGFCGWLVYKGVTSQLNLETVFGVRGGPNEQNQANSAVNNRERAYTIRPFGGDVLPDNNGNQRLDELVDQRLAEGRQRAEIVQEVRELYPDTPFEVTWIREGHTEYGRFTYSGGQMYPAWNQDPRSRR